MKIEQAAAMGLCRKACNFGCPKTGRCKYHDFASHNYLDLEVGECAVTHDQAEVMKREHNLSTIPKRRNR